jgi:hypothetical protein
MIGKLGEADAQEERRHQRSPAMLVDATEFQREGDVLGDVEPRQERMALKDDGALNRRRHDRLPAEIDVPAVGRMNPAKALRRVVLPEPDGPRMARN